VTFGHIAHSDDAHLLKTLIIMRRTTAYDTDAAPGDADAAPDDTDARMLSQRRAQSAMLAFMGMRLAAVICLVLLGLNLAGCTKCGWWWDERPRTCHDDSPPR
jgi:hypothetical protein